MSPPGGFKLAGGNAEFNDRQKQLFEQLQDVEKSLNKDKNVTQSDSEIFKVPSRIQRVPRVQGRREASKFRGRQSIFKDTNVVPRNRFRRNSQTIPDYHKNPSKWTKYSLEDSPDITHTSNSQAALSFLNQLRNRNIQKDKNDDKMDVDEMNENKNNEDGCSSSKRNKDAERIMFKKKTPKVDDSTIIVEKEEKPFYRNSKVIMPECVVGQKVKKVKERKIKKDISVGDKKVIKLDHLDENDED